LAETSIIPKGSTKYSIPILIIEDSPAISMLIEEFLTTLGYYDVRISNLGNTGLQQFKELINSGPPPLVFLDYNLPDMTADLILPKLLELRPNVKVVLLTALDRSEQGVKNVIMNGAYFYLQKPIRLIHLEETMNLLDGERLSMERKALEIDQLIQTLLGPSLVSLEKICEICKIKPDRALAYLKKVEAYGGLISSDDVKVISCNQCDSVLVEKENMSSLLDAKYLCSRCNATFLGSQSKWIITKGFRAKVKSKLNFKEKINY
jgi:response regulator RpfG family c-di-GMP phosphodiesterase